MYVDADALSINWAGTYISETTAGYPRLLDTTNFIFYTFENKWYKKQILINSNKDKWYDYIDRIKSIITFRLYTLLHGWSCYIYIIGEVKPRSKIGLPCQNIIKRTCILCEIFYYI